MKTINFRYKGVDYSLCYTRATVMRAEKEGLNVGNMEKMPITTMELLFKFAFLCNHKKVKPDVVTEIWESIENKADLVGKLMECYAETVETLMSNDDSKNAIKWEANF